MKANNDAPKSKYRRGTIPWVLLDIFIILLSFLAGLSFQNTTISKRDVATAQLSSYAKESDNGSIFMRVSSQELPSYKKTTKFLQMQKLALNEQYFYSPSFLGLTSSSGDLETVNLQAKGFETSEMSSFSLISAAFFSNTDKFEALDIDLYKKIENERYESEGVDDCVYIPDYLANLIIEKNAESFSDYDQFLASAPLVTITFGGIKRTHRIANIFRVNGFSHCGDRAKEEPSDKENGKLLSSFLNNYLIVPKTYFFDTFGSSLFVAFGASRFSYKRVCEVCFPPFQNESFTTDFFIKQNGLISKKDPIVNMFDIYAKNIGPIDGLSGFPLVFFLSLLPPFVVLISIIYSRHYFSNSLLTLTPFILLFALLLLSFIFNSFFLYPLISLNFNVFFNLFVLLLVAFFILFVYQIRRKKV